MTQLRDIGEFGLIKLIAPQEGGHPGVLVGIGDDTAVLEHGSHWLLYTTDMLVEGVHFSLETTTAGQLGHKALAVNMSDVAAMGGWPTFALISLGLPPDLSVAFVQELYRGMEAIAAQGGVAIVGGDTVSHPELLIINVALLGQVPAGQAVLRSGAQRGDLICVTNTLGDSAAGLALLSRGGEIPPSLLEVVDKHLLPQPRLREGRQLAGVATSMLDVSDGLAGDLHHICQASQVRAQIELERLPISPAVYEAADFVGCDPLEWVLRGGEDYELLFTIPPEEPLPAGASVIGQIIPGEPAIELVDGRGRREVLKPGAYDHFS
ncbi:MAG: thiamine-phosphate kinase [Limnochordia bacterium]|jgi:thiamine-monophosphate kinase